MAKRKQGKQRPFNRDALIPYAIPQLRIRMGPGESVYRYTITIPLEEIVPLKRQKATATDIDRLQQMFADHFGGCSRSPNSLGIGPRDPSNPQQNPEMNANMYFIVLTSPLPTADAYFRALREELEEALQEGVILIERQDAWIP